MTPNRPVGTTSALTARVSGIVRRGDSLAAEGIPYDSASFVSEVRGQISKHDLAAAITTVRRAEALLDKTQRDWTWLKELLSRVDELRDLAARSGVDLEVVDQRIGNARQQLRTLPLAEGSLEKAAASASLALVVLNDTLPKFYTQEAQQLAKSIREANERGEDVRESGVRLAQLLQALREGRLADIGQRFIDLRRAVTRIPRAPAVPPKMQQREEEEILLEARNLARRLEPDEVPRPGCTRRRPTHEPSACRPVGGPAVWEPRRRAGRAMGRGRPARPRANRCIGPPPGGRRHRDAGPRADPLRAGGNLLRVAPEPTAPRVTL